MATYQMIQDRVKAEAGFVPATSWIAEVKASYGLDASEAANRGHRQSGLKPCPRRSGPRTKRSVALQIGLAIRRPAARTGVVHTASTKKKKALSLELGWVALIGQPS
jgi:hypothetical protein